MILSLFIILVSGELQNLPLIFFVLFYFGSWMPHIKNFLAKSVNLSYLLLKLYRRGKENLNLILKEIEYMTNKKDCAIAAEIKTLFLKAIPIPFFAIRSE